MIIVSNYRRWRVEGGTYAFTLATFGRRPILTSPEGLAALRHGCRVVRKRWPFQVLAVVVLPDHLHAMWELPRGDANYSLRWKRLKEEFTRKYLADGGRERSRSDSRTAQGERAVWQRRFWEHLVRDEDDYQNCLDYIHYNPVKHGVSDRPMSYRWSSFRQFVKHGEYERDWGRAPQHETNSFAE